MKTLRVPHRDDGKYVEVQFFGRYGSVAVTRECHDGAWFQLTHAPTGQLLSNTRFEHLANARRCAADLAESIDWAKDVDAHVQPIIEKPWDEVARKKVEAAIAETGKRVGKIIRTHADAEDAAS